MNFSNRAKTMFCVAIAGLIFIYAVFFNVPYLFLVAAVFDWLPLPTGWMRLPKGTTRNNTALILHIVFTLVAYAIGLYWVITGKHIFAFVFLEIWWLAVMVGTFISR